MVSIYNYYNYIIIYIIIKNSLEFNETHNLWYEAVDLQVVYEEE